MFNGIIESLGTIIRVITPEQEGGKEFSVETGFSDHNSLEIGSSVAINGVCTTVTEINDTTFHCFASKETLEITNLGELSEGSRVNLERPLRYQGRIDGHLVYGHVDQTARVIKITSGESSIFEIEVTTNRDLLIPKGSIALNGISLTIYQLTDHSFSVMIIPHTLQETNLHFLQVGELVNLEFDSLGKYLKNHLNSITIHEN